MEVQSCSYDIKLHNKLWSPPYTSKLARSLNLEIQQIPSMTSWVPGDQISYAACQSFQCQGTRSNTRSTGCRIQCHSTSGTGSKGVYWLDPDLIQSDMNKFTMLIDSIANGHSVCAFSRLQKWAGINMTMFEGKAKMRNGPLSLCSQVIFFYVSSTISSHTILLKSFDVIKWSSFASPALL